MEGINTLCFHSKATDKFYSIQTTGGGIFHLAFPALARESTTLAGIHTKICTCRFWAQLLHPFSAAVNFVPGTILTMVPGDFPRKTPIPDVRNADLSSISLYFVFSVSGTADIDRATLLAYHSSMR